MSMESMICLEGRQLLAAAQSSSSVCSRERWQHHASKCPLCRRGGY